MAQELDLELHLRPYDPWDLKKNLSESDLRSGGSLILPRQDFEGSIIPKMGRALVENLGNGVEVKVHFIEEGHEAEDYTLNLIKYNDNYLLRRGWYNITKAKGFRTNDQIGLMWDNGSGRFLFHHIK